MAQDIFNPETKFQQVVNESENSSATWILPWRFEGKFSHVLGAGSYGVVAQFGDMAIKRMINPFCNSVLAERACREAIFGRFLNQQENANFTGEIEDVIGNYKEFRDGSGPGHPFLDSFFLVSKVYQRSNVGYLRTRN